MSSKTDKTNKGVKAKGFQLFPTPWPEINNYAAELKHRIATKKQAGIAGEYITNPVLDCDIGDLPSRLLLSWMWFNPFGPTEAGLLFTQIPGSEEGLITFRFNNPFDNQSAAFGLVPTDTMDHLSEAVKTLFAANGDETCRLFNGLPTAVFHRGNWPGEINPPSFGAEPARRVFKAAAASCWPRDTQSICNYLRRYDNPWERTRAELEESMKPGLSLSGEGREEFDEELFNQWFDLVSEYSHVKAEYSNFLYAWNGAINFRKSFVP